MVRGSLLAAPLCAAVLCFVQVASAKELRVPRQQPTIQAAVDAAVDGDVIRVASGSYCGATIRKRVSLLGDGQARVVGCSDGPTLGTSARVGFYLPGSAAGNAASGSKISGFVFDGRGVSSANLEPLAFGVFARFAREVVVSHNRFEGTAQSITSTAGDRWLIEHNTIEGLTVLDCTGLCTGGDGIVLALAHGALAGPGGDAAAINRPEDNLILENSIEGTPPAGFSDFSMAGILLLSADHTTVLNNRLRLRDNPLADAVGQGILVSNTCCGLGTSFLPGSRNTILALNDGRQSEVAIVVEGADGVNTQGLFLFRNRGLEQIADALPPLAFARRALSPARASPTW